MVRLQKYLAACGAASRRGAEECIRQGRVQVNGQIAELGQSITPDDDLVQLDGKTVASERKVYLVLNKPPGLVTTLKDTHGRATVLDCLDGIPERVFPIGRLDKDVRGVLLFTNDGELANRLLHPAYGVEKVYVAEVRGIVTLAVAHTLEQGVLLEDGPTAPAKVKILDNAGVISSTIQVTLREGKKREVKRMCAAVGHRVIRLRRIAFGNIRANGIKPGEWRYLTEGEIASLHRLAGVV